MKRKTFNSAILFVTCIVVAVGIFKCTCGSLESFIENTASNVKVFGHVSGQVVGRIPLGDVIQFTLYKCEILDGKSEKGWEVVDDELFIHIIPMKTSSAALMEVPFSKSWQEWR